MLWGARTGQLREVPLYCPEKRLDGVALLDRHILAVAPPVPVAVGDVQRQGLQPVLLGLKRTQPEVIRAI